MELAQDRELLPQVGDHVLLLAAHPADEQEHGELDQDRKPHDHDGGGGPRATPLAGASAHPTALVNGGSSQ